MAITPAHIAHRSGQVDRDGTCFVNARNVAAHADRTRGAGPELTGAWNASGLEVVFRPLQLFRDGLMLSLRLRSRPGLDLEHQHRLASLLVSDVAPVLAARNK